MRTQVTLEDFLRLSNRYMVSFLNKELKHQEEYAPYLSDSAKNQQQNPLINFAKNCLQVKAHPLDLKKGDKIVFTPQMAWRKQKTLAKLILSISHLSKILAPSLPMRSMSNFIMEMDQENEALEPGAKFWSIRRTFPTLGVSA